MPSTATVVTSALAVSALSYVVYFDYQRRHNADFRRKLKKSNRDLEKAEAAHATAKKNEIKQQIIKKLDASLAAQQIPSGMKEKEEFFLAQVTQADEFAQANDIENAAIAYYKALSVYPVPTDLLGIYEQSVKQPILELVLQMISARTPESLLASLGAKLDTTVE